jgi:hypothetical protein
LLQIPVWSGTDARRDTSAPSFTGPPPEVPGNPWRKQTGWNVSGCVIYLLFLCAYFFYFYVRIRYTLGGGILWYSLFVLVFEVLASSSMVIHGLALLRVRKHVRPPPDLQPPEQDYNIRVVIPCYTVSNSPMISSKKCSPTGAGIFVVTLCLYPQESVDIVRLTVLAAANAQLPGKCRRTVYLLDDGKDPAKCAWVAMQVGKTFCFLKTCQKMPCCCSTLRESRQSLGAKCGTAAETLRYCLHFWARAAEG